MEIRITFECIEREGVRDGCTFPWC